MEMNRAEKRRGTEMVLDISDWYECYCQRLSN